MAIEIKKHYAGLSEAIREGAKLRHQTTDTYFDMGGGSCALGAALEACFGYEEDDTEALSLLYPYLDVLAPCPAAECNVNESSIEGLIPHLNDDHKWTREAIADWVETEEEKLGFVTLLEETEALKPKMISEFETVKATA